MICATKPNAARKQTEHEPKTKRKAKLTSPPPTHSCLFSHLASFTTHPHVSNRDIYTQRYIFFYMSRKFMRKVCQEILNLQAVSIIYHPYYIQIYTYIYTQLFYLRFAVFLLENVKHALNQIYCYPFTYFACHLIVCFSFSFVAFVSFFSLFLLTKFLVAGGIKCEDKL